MQTGRSTCSISIPCHLPRLFCPNSVPGVPFSSAGCGGGQGSYVWRARLLDLGCVVTGLDDFTHGHKEDSLAFLGLDSPVLLSDAI